MYTLFRLINTLMKYFVHFREIAVKTSNKFMDNPMLIWFSLIKLLVRCSSQSRQQIKMHLENNFSKIWEKALNIVIEELVWKRFYTNHNTTWVFEIK